MYVTPQTFSSHLNFLKKSFTVISIDDLASIMKNEAVPPQGKTICVVTFDDGWLDFYTYAYPLLVAHELPATVFLPTNFIGSEKQFWTERFAFLLMVRLQKGKTGVPASVGNNQEIAKILTDLLELEGQYKDQLENGIELLKKNQLGVIDRVLEALAEAWSVPAQDNTMRDFVNWDEVQEMHSSGLINFGSHTKTHRILTTLSAAEIQVELSDSRDELIDRNVVSREQTSFCYPNGNCSPAIAKLVESSAYDLAVTTKKGTNDMFSDRFLLNRIGVHQDMASTVPLFASRIAGFI